MVQQPKQERANRGREAVGPLREPASLNERLLNAILSISGSPTLEDALGPLLDAALDVTRMDGGGVYWVHDEVAVLRHHRGLPEAFIREVTRMPLAPLPVQILLEQREPVEVGEVSPVLHELFHRHGIRHVFSFPLQAQGLLFGFLNVGSTRPEAPERADIRALQVLVREIEAMFFRLYSEKALRESEERFNAFMDNSPTVAWMKDEHGRYVYLSRTYTRRSGRRPEEWQGKTVFDLWPRETAEEFWRNDQEVLRTGRTIEVVEENPAPGGGHCFWWNFKFPFQDAAGRRFVGGIGVDITERRRMEVLLHQANERLEEQIRVRTEELTHTVDRLQNAMEELAQRADQLQKVTLELVQAEDRERQRLAEFLHDDLQQTLAAAKFRLSVLGGRLEGSEAARELVEETKQIVKEAIEKCRNLSHELGPPLLYRSQLDAVFEWLAGQMESKHGLAVHVEIRGRVECHCEPVRSFLYRTAQEILFNIVKHAQVGEAKLRLQRVRDQLWLTISDRGRGFDPASPREAAGFGLTTIRERAELLGGRLTIKSTAGKGSIFFITVPDISMP